MTNFSKLLIPVFAAFVAAGCATAEDVSHDGSPVGSSSAEASVRGGFDLWQSESGEYYFHLESANHEILLYSEGYQTRTGALNGILSVLDNGGLDSRYQIHEGADGQAYVRLVARNGEIIGASEGYASVQGAERLIDSSIRNIAGYLEHWDTFTGARFQVFEGAGGEFYFNLYAKNGQVVLSSEGYTTEAAALNGAFVVADGGLDADAYQLREAADGSVYLVLRAGNNEIVAVSETYSTRSNAVAARDAIIELIPAAELL